MRRSICTLGLILATCQGRGLAQGGDPLSPTVLPSFLVQPAGDFPSTVPSPRPVTDLVAVDDDLAPRAWARADYLMWWTKRAGLPPLVVTGLEQDAFPG